MGGIHAEAGQWEEAEKPQLRTKMRAPGIYCISAPSVPLYSRASEGLQLQELKHTASFVFGSNWWEDGIFFRVLSSCFVSCLLTRGEFLCLSPRALLTTNSLERWSGWVSGCSQAENCEDARMSGSAAGWGGTDMAPCEILPFAPLLIHYHALASLIFQHGKTYVVSALPFQPLQMGWIALTGLPPLLESLSLSTPDLCRPDTSQSGDCICPIIREHEAPSSTSLPFFFFK